MNVTDVFKLQLNFSACASAYTKYKPFLALPVEDYVFCYSVSSLSKLEILYVSGNPLKDSLDPEMFNIMTILDELHLGDCHLSDLPEG